MVLLEKKSATTNLLNTSRSAF